MSMLMSVPLGYKGYKVMTLNYRGPKDPRGKVPTKKESNNHEQKNIITCKFRYSKIMGRSEKVGDSACSCSRPSFTPIITY